MTTTSKPAGVSRSWRSGKYSLALREQGKGNITEAMKKNGIFVANLSASIRSVPKYVTAALAANSLVQVILATKHDSSRAAANWKLSVSGVGLHPFLDPAEYHEAGESWGVIGGRGDLGDSADTVLEYKKMYYGISKSPSSTLFEVDKGGRLFHQLGVGQQGNYRVDLFNPILGDLNQRRAGAQHTGHTYAYYAFDGDSAETFMPGLENVRESIGSGYIPYLLTKLNDIVHAESNAGRILKP